MKVRNGWVSNSSTSSFILTGWSLSEEEQDAIVDKIYGPDSDHDIWYYFLEDNDFDDYFVADDYQVNVGHIVYYGEGDETEIAEIENLVEKANTVLDKLPEVKEVIGDRKAKLVIGSVGC